MESARNDLLKSKEQLEEEKKISLSFRIKPLEIDGLGTYTNSTLSVLLFISLDYIFLVSGCDGLRKKAAELWQTIVTLETEKYDLEERSKRQDYDVSSNDSLILFLNYHDSQLILLIIILRQGDFW